MFHRIPEVLRSFAPTAKGHRGGIRNLEHTSVIEKTG